MYAFVHTILMTYSETFCGVTEISTIRRKAHVAMDLLPAANLNIVPGDSVTIDVSDPVGGLAADPHTGFGSAVYCYVSVRPQNQPGKGGSVLTTDAFRWPVVDSLTFGGDKWYCIRMDTTFATKTRGSPVANSFCVDLNDNLFTPGDTVRNTDSPPKAAIMSLRK